MIEVITSRTEFSKTYNIGKGKYRSDMSIAPLHYKEDYSDDRQPWLNSYYTPVEDDDYLTYDKMPWITVRVYKKKVGYEVKSKYTNQKFIVELDEKKPNIVDVDFRTEVSYRGVRLWTILKTGNVKALRWKVTETNREIGPHMLDFSEVVEAKDYDGHQAEIVTTKVPVNKEVFTWDEEFTGKIVGDTKTPVYPIKIDADIVVDASADDCYDLNNNNFSTSSDRFNAGAYSASYDNYLSAARFRSVVPQGATISAANLRLECMTQFDGANVLTKIDMEDTDDAAAFSNRTNYDARSRTTAKIDWDISSVWTVGNYYNSDDFASVFQEVVDRSGYIEGNHVVVFWENDGSSTAANNLRRAGSFDNTTYDAPMLQVTWTGTGQTEIVAAVYGLFMNNSVPTSESPPNLGRYQRHNSLWCSEVLCNFDMTGIFGTITNAALKFTVGGYNTGTGFVDVDLKEQNKTAPESWSNPPQYDDFAYTAWDTELSDVPLIRDAGEYIISDTADNIKNLVQNWINTPSSNWGMILGRNDLYFSYYQTSISDVTLLLTGVNDSGEQTILRRRRDIAKSL